MLSPANYEFAMGSECRRLMTTTQKPHGYSLPNGVIVVYSPTSSTQNNMATLQHAYAMFAELTIVVHVDDHFETINRV